MTPAELRELMAAKGLKAEDVAVLVSASERAVFYWLSDERAMSPATSELLELKTAMLPDVDRAADST